MTDLATKHQRLARLRPLSPETVASLAMAWEKWLGRPVHSPIHQKSSMHLSKRQLLKDLRQLSPESVASLTAAWEVRMVFESNALASSPLSHRETALILTKGLAVKDHSLLDQLQANNFKAAWKIVLELAEPQCDFTEHILKFLHSILLAGIEVEGAGRYKDATKNKVEPQIDNLFCVADATLDFVERAAILHHGITQIKPFKDGNGRIARLAMNFTLVAGGYPPVSISPNLKKEYNDALEAADNGDFGTWQNFLNTQLDREFDFYLDALAQPVS